MANLIIYGIFISALTAFSFGYDKRQARRGGWRIRERTLLMLVIFGGAPGAFAARHTFRHKTRKQPFVTQLWLITGLQLALFAALLWLGEP